MKKISKVLMVAALSTAALSANAGTHAAASSNGGLFAGWKANAGASLSNRLNQDNFLLTRGSTLVAQLNVSIHRDLGNGTLGVSEDLMDATGNGGAASATRGNGTYTNFGVNYASDLNLPVFNKITLGYHRLDNKTGGFLQDFITLHLNSKMGFGMMLGTGNSFGALQAATRVSADQYGFSYTRAMKGDVTVYASYGNTQQVSSRNHSSVWSIGANKTFMKNKTLGVAYVKENAITTGVATSTPGFQFTLGMSV